MSDNNELKKFAESIEAEIAGRLHDTDMVDEQVSFREQVFTTVVANILVEYGVTEDVEICFMDKKYGRGRMRINAWSVNEDTGKVILIASLYHAEQLTTIHRRDLETAVQRAARVFEAATKAFHKEMESASDAYSMMQRLNEVADSTLDIHVLILTNGIAAGQVENISQLAASPAIRWDIWDMQRLERCAAAGKTYETIEIDLLHASTGALPCLKMPEDVADYDAYLAIIPGELLFRLYEEYGPRLLELNVRSFLQARGKVNKGIRDTIRNEPVRFLAYNNGITITAERLTTRNDTAGNLEIVAMHGFQVVNGGQTMASIHRARKTDQADLDDVFVQAKITVVPEDQMQELVSKVSRYSNTQNKVSEADFSSNDPFHVEIERLSEKIWCPGEQSRWFYERARGQYQVARNKKGTTPARKRKFDETVPKTQKYDKISLAKYINTWDQLPHIVSLGNQKNFIHFMTSLEGNGENWIPDENYYKDLIARAIICKKAEKIARQHKFPAYRANAVAYSVALLSYKTIGRIDLQQIWANQQVSDATADTLYDWMPIVLQEIVDSAGERNVTEWCKKEDCWRTVQTIDVTVPDKLQDELAEGQPLPTVGSKRGKRGEGLTHLDRENIAKTMGLSDENWLNIYRWTIANELHATMSGIAFTLCGYAANSWQKVPSARQAKQAVIMINQFNDDTVE